mgnify:CR=1 FL=1
MKRALYFLFERLQVTIYERTAIYVLSSVLILAVIGNIFIKPSVNASILDYDPIFALFEEKSAAINQEREQLLQRYFPQPIENVTLEIKAPDSTKIVESSLSNQPTEIISDTTRTRRAPVALTEVININTADVSELVRLPGIGPAIAARIVEFRYEFGLFAEKEDIKKVRGIGKTRFESIKDFITVE